VRYTLNQWEALCHYTTDGDLLIDNGAVERANRNFAIGRNNWTFFGSDQGGRTAAVLAQLRGDVPAGPRRAHAVGGWPPGHAAG
jgi:hypothetical protein